MVILIDIVSRSFKGGMITLRVDTEPSNLTKIMMMMMILMVKAKWSRGLSFEFHVIFPGVLISSYFHRQVAVNLFTSDITQDPHFSSAISQLSLIDWVDKNIPNDFLGWIMLNMKQEYHFMLNVFYLFLFVMSSPLFVHVQKNSSNILKDGARIKDHPTSDSIFSV